MRDAAAEVDFWIATMTDRLVKLTDTIDPRDADISRLADSWKDEVAAQWLRKTTSTRWLRQQLDHVTFCRRSGDVTGALLLILEADRHRYHVMGLLGQKALTVGKKVTEGGARGGRRVPPVRDLAMARVYQAERSRAGNARSDSAIKQAIGAKYGLGRSAAIAAIDRGLKKLSGEGRTG
jgi:hypothetical protein